MAKKTFKTTVVREGSMCFIPVPFDPRPVFGKVRAPVKVSLNGYTYRSTIASMGNGPCVPLRRSNREAAGLEGGEVLAVTLELDLDPRAIEPPPDLVKALRAAPPAWERWGELSYSHQREHAEAIEGARKPETRARRIAAAVKMIAARHGNPAAGRRAAGAAKAGTAEAAKAGATKAAKATTATKATTAVTAIAKRPKASGARAARAARAA